MSSRKVIFPDVISISVIECLIFQNYGGNLAQTQLFVIT